MGKSYQTGMVQDFLLDSFEIGRIIPNNVLEMKKAVSINPCKFDRNGPRSVAHDLTFYLYTQLAGSSSHYNPQMALYPSFQIRLDGEKASAKAQIENFFGPIMERVVGSKTILKTKK